MVSIILVYFQTLESLDLAKKTRNYANMFQKCTYLCHDFIIFMTDSQYSRRVIKICVHKFGGDNSVEHKVKLLIQLPVYAMHASSMN